MYLPENVIRKIYAFTQDLKDIINLAKTCKVYYLAFRHPYVFGSICLRKQVFESLQLKMDNLKIQLKNLTAQMNLYKEKGLRVYPILPRVGDSVRKVDRHGRVFGKVGKVLHIGRNWREGMTVKWNKGGIECNVRCRSLSGRSMLVFA